MKYLNLYSLSVDFKKDQSRQKIIAFWTEKYQFSFQYIFLVILLTSSLALAQGQVSKGNYNSVAKPLGTPSMLSAPTTPNGLTAKRSISTRNSSNFTGQDTVREIFQKLVEARGDFRMKKPEKIYLRDEVSRVASIDYNKLEIVIEQKAYDVCKNFGESAVAFLIGHELTHYYEKHAWRTNFGMTMLRVVRLIKMFCFHS